MRIDRHTGTSLVAAVVTFGLGWALASRAYGAEGSLNQDGRATVATQPPPRALTRDDVLSVRDGRFFLEGEPFAEISFNKFDLLWQLHDQLAAGKTLDDANPLVQAQDKALRDLHQMGFRTIRVFALPWGPGGPAAYADPDRRKTLYAALDRMLDLCDRHDVRVVWSLGAGTFTDARIEPGKGWVYGEEQERELVSDPESRGRRLLYQSIDETVARYRSRKAVLMWEISNEVTLSADIGDQERVYNGQRMPTLKEVAGFFDDVGKRIKAADPLRLVNSGGSSLREHQWHRYTETAWKLDTAEDQFRCLELLYARTAIDVPDIHWYPSPKMANVIAGPEGGEALLGLDGYMGFAVRLGKPLMVGEIGMPALAKDEKNRALWSEHPDYFASWDDTAAAKPWMERLLSGVIDAGVQLSYWWCYQSDRPVDQKDPQRFDLSRERTPELIACFIEANRRLQAKLGVAGPAASQPPGRTAGNRP